MIRLGAWIAVFAPLALMWQECGEDLAIFCYRIGCNVFMFTGRRALALVPVRHTISEKFARTKAACSNPSFTFSTPSMTRRDFEN